jgi:prephenate dehydratase
MMPMQDQMPVQGQAPRQGRYAYLGPAGTFTEAALRSLEDAQHAEHVPCATIQAALEAVRTESAEHAVVPIESSVDGAVTATLDELAAADDLLISAEVLMPISFALLARPGARLDEIKTVAASPVASGDLDAALAGAFAAPGYGLSVLADEVHDRAGAVTRFVVVGKPGPLPAPTGSDRTSLVAFLADDHPGALMEILTEFAVRGINLSRIESRPTGDRLGRYYFFVDCEGHVDDARVGEALMGLRRVCADVRFVGSYPRGDGGVTQVRKGTSDAEFAEAAAWLGRLRYGRV